MLLKFVTIIAIVIQRYKGGKRILKRKKKIYSPSYLNDTRASAYFITLPYLAEGGGVESRRRIGTSARYDSHYNVRQGVSRGSTYGYRSPLRQLIGFGVELLIRRRTYTCTLFQETVTYATGFDEYQASEKSFSFLLYDNVLRPSRCARITTSIYFIIRRNHPPRATDTATRRYPKKFNGLVITSYRKDNKINVERVNAMGTVTGRLNNDFVSSFFFFLLLATLLRGNLAKINLQEKGGRYRGGGYSLVIELL